MKTRHIRLKRKQKNRRTMRSKPRVFIIGVAGPSGCGKTFFANLLKERLISNKIPSSAVKMISCDNYYKTFYNSDGTTRKQVSKNEYEKTPDYLKYNWDHPDAVDLPLLEKHLISLKNGEDIVIPEFDYLTSVQTTNPKNLTRASKLKIIIVEGLFTLYLESLRNIFDLRLYIDADHEVCLVQRLIRDFEKRDADYDRTVHQYIDNVKPATCAYIEPTRVHANFTIHNLYKSDYKNSMSMICEYIMFKVSK